MVCSKVAWIEALELEIIQLDALLGRRVLNERSERRASRGGPGQQQGSDRGRERRDRGRNRDEPRERYMFNDVGGDSASRTSSRGSSIESGRYRLGDTYIACRYHLCVLQKGTDPNNGLTLMLKGALTQAVLPLTPCFALAPVPSLLNPSLIQHPLLNTACSRS